jgi:hypothetical protein
LTYKAISFIMSEEIGNEMKQGADVIDT